MSALVFSLGRILAGLAMIAAVSAGAVLPARAMDDAQRREIETVVRDYLIANPEVLVEAMGALEAKRQAQERADQSAAIAALGGEIAATPPGTEAGNPDGDVTVTEFFDYNCGYCKRAASDMAALVESDPKLRVVLKETPVLGASSLAASRVSLALREVAPQRYAEFQRTLLASRGEVDEARALAVAAQLGVEEAQLRPLLDGEAVRTALAETSRLAMRLGMSGTPSYVVGDAFVAGAVGADALAARIANVRQCGSASC